MAQLTRVTETLITFKSKLAGAISRLLESKLTETVSVGDFGSLSPDATQAFQKAVISGASVITVPSGQYNVHDLTVPDGVVLKATGKGGATIKFTGDLYYPLRLGSYSKVKGLTLDFSTATNVDKAIFIENKQGSEVTGNSIIGPTTGHTIYADGSGMTGTMYKQIKVHDNYITSGQGAGVYIYGVKEFIVSDNKLHGVGDGILATGPTRIRCSSEIVNNVVMDSSGQGVATMLITNARDQQAYEGLVVSGNRIARAKANGIIIQSDLTVCEGNVVTDSGTTTSHQGILVNANGVTVGGNIVRHNTGVGIDMGNCRKSTVVGNLVEENGWLGIEVNRCEQVTVMGNVLNLNLSGKATSNTELQAAILCHEGSGGYPFSGENKDITIVGNTINGGDGQDYAIYTDAGSYKITIGDNTCRASGIKEDIVCDNVDVMASNNSTRWSPSGSARASIESGGVVKVSGVDGFVAVNGTGDVNQILPKYGKIPDGATLRLLAINGLTLKTGAGTNISLQADVVLAANQSYLLWWNKFANVWVKAA